MIADKLYEWIFKLIQVSMIKANAETQGSNILSPMEGF